MHPIRLHTPERAAAYARYRLEGDDVKQAFLDLLADEVQALVDRVFGPTTQVNFWLDGTGNLGCNDSEVIWGTGDGGGPRWKERIWFYKRCEDGWDYDWDDIENFLVGLRDGVLSESRK